MSNLCLIFLATVLAFSFSQAGSAQTALTATCKDGTNWSGAKRSGACRGHGGVQAFGTAVAAPAGVAAAATPASPVPSQSRTVPSNAVNSTTAISPRPQAPGGAGQVWVNTSTKVYHCPGDKYYGKTKHGNYLTESAAKAAGDHPDHGKACGLS